MFSKPKTKSTFKGDDFWVSFHLHHLIVLSTIYLIFSHTKANYFEADLQTSWTDNQTKCTGQTLQSEYDVHKIIWRYCYDDVLRAIFTQKNI